MKAGEFGEAFPIAPNKTRRAKITTIDVPDATDTFIHHINASGQLVGVYRDQNDRTHGFVATP